MNSAWIHRRTALLVGFGMSLIGGAMGSQKVPWFFETLRMRIT
jgi:hypothetical protein